MSPAPRAESPSLKMGHSTCSRFLIGGHASSQEDESQQNCSNKRLLWMAENLRKKPDNEFCTICQAAVSIHFSLLSIRIRNGHFGCKEEETFEKRRLRGGRTKPFPHCFEWNGWNSSPGAGSTMPSFFVTDRPPRGQT